MSEARGPRLDHLEADVGEIRTTLARLESLLTRVDQRLPKKSGKGFRILVGTAAVLISAYAVLLLALSLVSIIAGHYPA